MRSVRLVSGGSETLGTGNIGSRYGTQSSRATLSRLTNGKLPKSLPRSRVDSNVWLRLMVPPAQHASPPLGPARPLGRRRWEEAWIERADRKSTRLHSSH